MEQDYIDELQQLLTSAKHPRTVSMLEKALAEATGAANGSGPQPEAAGAEVGGGDIVMKPLMKQKDGSISSAKISNYGWDQSDKFVKIYITDIKGLDTLKTENIRPDFSHNAVKVELLDILGKNYVLTVSNLFSSVVPEKCTVKAKSGMVIVSMCKKKSSESWEFLTAREKKLKESKDRKPAKLDDDDKSDPSQSLMKLMKQMYDEGDDDMKRTIAKSWHESQEKRKNEAAGGGDMEM